MVDLAATVWRDYVTDGVPASGKWAPHKADVRKWGAWLEARQTGDSLLYTFSSTTADVDPGDGAFRLNNATLASVTAAYIDNLDAAGNTVSGIVDGWDDSTSTAKGTLTIRGVDDSAVVHAFSVSGSVVDGTGYRKVTLAYVGGNGAFVNGEQYLLTFSRSGDKGDVSLNQRNRFSGYVPVYDLDEFGAPGTTHAIQNLIDLGTVAVPANDRLEAIRVIGTQTGDGVMRAFEFGLTATDTATGDAVRGVIGVVTIGGAVVGKAIHGHAFASVNHTSQLVGVVGQVTPAAGTVEAYSFQATVGTGSTAALVINPINDLDTVKFGIYLRQSLSARMNVTDAFIAYSAYGAGNFLRMRDAAGVEIYQVLSTGKTLAPLGSVGAPTWSFVGDTNTGMYSPAADEVAFAANGVQVLRLRAVGGSATSALVVGVNNNAGVNNVSVTLGAVDSGGSGFRVMRVPN